MKGDANVSEQLKLSTREANLNRKLDPYSSIWDWLLLDLRHLCKTHGLSHEDLARIMSRSRSHVSNILTGRRSIRYEDASLIDRRYNTGDRYQLLLHWARLGHDSNWFGQFLEYELRAQAISAFQALTIPGLLQTPEYAHALIKAVGEPVDVDTEVARRMARQDILTKPDPALLWVLITENVIDWPIGGRDVMRRQLAHLLELAELPNIGVRVVERTAGSHAGVEGSFSVMSGNFGEIAYTDSPGAGRLVTSSTEVRSYQARYNRIGQMASPENTSREIIHRVMEAL